MSFSFSTEFKERFPYDGEQIAQIEQFVNDSIAGIKHDKVLVLGGIWDDRLIKEIMDFMGDRCCDGIDPEFHQGSFLLYVTVGPDLEYVIEKLKDPQAGNILHYGNHMYSMSELNDDDHFKVLCLVGGPTITKVHKNREVHISSDQNTPVLHITFRTGYCSDGRRPREGREFIYRCNCAVPCIITHLTDPFYCDQIYGDSTGGCHFTIGWYSGRIHISFTHYQQKCSNCGQISDDFNMCPHMIRCKACTIRHRIIMQCESCVYCWMEEEEQRNNYHIDPHATQYGILDAIEGRDTKLNLKLSDESHPYNAGISIGKTLRDILQPDNLEQVVSVIYSTLDPPIQINNLRRRHSDQGLQGT